MGAVWPRTVAPMGSISRPQARKLTTLWSFFVANAILRSTFLVLTTIIVRMLYVHLVFLYMRG